MIAHRIVHFASYLFWSITGSWITLLDVVATHLGTELVDTFNQPPHTVVRHEPVLALDLASIRAAVREDGLLEAKDVRCDLGSNTSLSAKGCNGNDGREEATQAEVVVPNVANRVGEQGAVVRVENVHWHVGVRVAKLVNKLLRVRLVDAVPEVAATLVQSRNVVRFPENESVRRY